MNTLAIQGGGMLGYGQSIVLSKLEELNKKQCYEMFDLIAGTSVGAIQGCLLSVGIKATDIQSFFTIDAPNIFKKNIFSSISQLWGAKYNSSALESALKEKLGERTLSECKTKLLVTSYDWASDRPVYFKSYEKSYESKDWIVIGYDSPIKLWQIARASSSAQVYFKGFKYNDLTLIDGGNIGDNAPDVLAISESLKFSNLYDIDMLSLGSGDTIWKESPDSMINPSVLRAALSTIKIVFSAGESSDVYKASKLLGNNYYRLSPDLGNGYDIDDASEHTLNALKMAAEKLLLSSDEILLKFGTISVN